MGINPYFEGLNRVLSNLARAEKGIEANLHKGLIEAGQFIKGQAMQRTPVDDGNLRASARVIWGKDGENFRVVIGYESDYAIFVHERPARHDPGTDWKFLERAITENEREIATLIYRRLRPILQ